MFNRRVATIELAHHVQASLRDAEISWPYPALKDRARFMPTLRVESIYFVMPPGVSTARSG
jgi:hypothetical protein